MWFEKLSQSFCRCLCVADVPHQKLLPSMWFPHKKGKTQIHCGEAIKSDPITTSKKRENEHTLLQEGLFDRMFTMGNTHKSHQRL